jgi:hypothetical protein
MKEADHNEKLGTSEAIERAAKLSEAAGVPEKIAGEAAMRHDGYLKSTTPLSEVRETIDQYWAERDEDPPIP